MSDIAMTELTAEYDSGDEVAVFIEHVGRILTEIPDYARADAENNYAQLILPISMLETLHEKLKARYTN